MNSAVTVYRNSIYVTDLFPFMELSVGLNKKHPTGKTHHAHRHVCFFSFSFVVFFVLAGRACVHVVFILSVYLMNKDVYRRSVQRPLWAHFQRYTKNFDIE